MILNAQNKLGMIRSEIFHFRKRQIIRIIRPIEANEVVAWTVTLVLLPLIALTVACAVVTLRRKNR